MAHLDDRKVSLSVLGMAVLAANNPPASCRVNAPGLGLAGSRHQKIVSSRLLSPAYNRSAIRSRHEISVQVLTNGRNLIPIHRRERHPLRTDFLFQENAL